MAARLAPIVHLPANELLAKLSDRTKGFVYLKRKMDLDVGQAVDKLKLEGVGTLIEPRRKYPQNYLASQVLGTVGTDNYGLSGLESRFDKQLHGSDGKERLVKDALDQFRGVFDTLRASQATLEQELRRARADAQDRERALLRPLLLSGALSEFALNGPLNVGLVLLAAERGWGASGMAWIVSGFGVGAALSALLLTVLGRLPRAGLLQPVSLVLASAGIAAVGLMPVLAGAIALASASGVVSSVCGGLSNALVQTASDPGYLGRVTSVTSLSAFGLSPLSYPLFGSAAAAWGTGPVFVACGAIGTLGAVVTLAAAAVRGAELPRESVVRVEGTAAAPETESAD